MFISMTKKKIFIVFILVVVALILGGCGETDNNSDKEKSSGSTYETPVKYYTESVESGDYKTFKKSFPPFMDIADEDDLITIRESLEEEYGKDFKITYKITDKKKFTDEEIEDEQEDIGDYCKKNVEVEEGYTLKVKITVKGSENKKTNEVKMKVVKIDGEWYYFPI